MGGLQTFDSIVVGAGAAGCVVARRLADAGEQVLLIEAGSAEIGPAIATVDAVAALQQPSWFWPGVRAELSAAEVEYRQGLGLGGGTAVNSMVLTPGDRADYDRWENEFGCAGWDWSSIEPYLDRAVEALAPTEAEFGPVANLVAAAAHGAGHSLQRHPHPRGGVEADRLGLVRASLARDGANRRSAADAYLLDAGPSLSVRSGSAVTRILIEHRRAVGVELVDGTRLNASRIVVAAGALHSPHLLARSGVGGSMAARTLEDHPSFTFTIDLPPELRQEIDHPCPPVSAVLRWRSAAASRGIDLLAMVMDHVGIDATGRRYGAVIVTMTDVASRGRLAWERGQGFGGITRFSPGWLVDGQDRERMRNAVRHMGAILTNSELIDAVAGVYIDDRGTDAGLLPTLSDPELDRWLTEHPGPVSHVGASAPMSTGPDAIVAPDGSVVGHAGLYVVDASILPHLPNGNPQLPIMAVSERLAAGLVS